MLNNKRILKNTLLLYIRMFLLMGIALYTSRIVLDTLGVEDFGIYNIVGGVVVLFSFINNALTSATRRFINFNLGKNDLKESQKVFSASLSIHILIAVLILFVGESIGLWFLNTQLNIPENRFFAANIVYQFSIASTCLGISMSPYDATIVAFERMAIYSYLSILEGILKLLIVYILVISTFDKLIFYAFLIFAVTSFIAVLKLLYCKKHFTICNYHFVFDKQLLSSIASFSGWSLFGQIAYIGSTTGLNMIINVFYGVLLNAAMGIAQQVNGAIYNFVSNFQMAFNPQIIQTYSSGDMKVHHILISRASRISYYLLFIISLPVLFNTDFILGIWLKEVPEKSVIFTQLIIIFSLIEALGAPMWMSMQAVGKIKKYQIIISSINILNIPLAFVLLKNDFSPESIFYVKIILGLIMYVFRVFYILPIINFSKKQYCIKVLMPTCLITIITVLLLSLLACELHGIEKFFITSTLSVILILCLVYSIGITKEERTSLKLLLKR